MKLPLDTHTFMWWDSAPHKIPEATTILLKHLTNEILLSLVSFREMQIKVHDYNITERNIFDFV